jgi:protein O-GlcNAc transferase
MVPEPLTISRILQAAQAHQNAGRLKEAEACYQRVLAEQPNHPQALCALGMIAFASRRLESALDFMQKAAAAAPAVADFTCNVGAVLEKLGRRDEAEQTYRRAIDINPQCAPAHNNLSNLLREKGDHEAALAEVQIALELQPKYAEALCNRANVYKATGRIDLAIADYQAARDLRPDIIETHTSLAQLFHLQGKLDEAAEACRVALRRWPNGQVLHKDLGCLLQEMGKPIDAMAAFKEALRLDPNLASAHNGMGQVQEQIGSLDQAVASFRAAVRLRPDHAGYHSDLLFALLLHPDDDPRKIALEHQEWNRRHAQPLAKFIRPHENDRSRDRRLRIGYVSPDFCRHVVGWAMLPLLQQHDRRQFEIFCYANVAQPDRVTQRLRDAADQWRNIASIDDEAAAEMICQDKIDILVDLALHGTDNRLKLMARKPAPVQVTYLGYCGGTGLKAIDYRFSDPFIDPPETDPSVYSEKTFRLPDTYWSYDPGESVPEVSPPPSLQNGYITFGSLNNLRKVSRPCMDLWMQILAASPRSRMLMLSYEGSHLDDIRQRFARAGIDPARLDFVGYQSRTAYLQTFARIDIALDSFPYNGGVTTCNSLWMGVPVVTLSGRTSLGRAGSSILNNVGLPDLVATAHEQYVQIALNLAADVNRLSDLRRNLRPMMQRSPLLDGPRHTRNIEAAYRQMWLSWCQNH